MREASPAKIEERKIVAHSILLFFAMEQKDQENYLPGIDPEIEYVYDGDTGDTTNNPAYYFCLRSMDYLAVFPPRCSRIIGDMLYEMRYLVNLMAEISPIPPRPSERNDWFYLWYLDPSYSGVTGTANILWRFLRRYASLIIADPRWELACPMLSFDDISKHFTVHT